MLWRISRKDVSSASGMVFIVSLIAFVSVEIILWKLFKHTNRYTCTLLLFKSITNLCRRTIRLIFPCGEKHFSFFHEDFVHCYYVAAILSDFLNCIVLSRKTICDVTHQKYLKWCAKIWFCQTFIGFCTFICFPLFHYGDFIVNSLLSLVSMHFPINRSIDHWVESIRFRSRSQFSDSFAKHTKLAKAIQSHIQRWIQSIAVQETKRFSTNIESAFIEDLLIFSF